MAIYRGGITPFITGFFGPPCIIYHGMQKPITCNSANCRLSLGFFDGFVEFGLLSFCWFIVVVAIGVQKWILLPVVMGLMFLLGLSALTMKLRITASNIVRISTDVFQQTGDFCYIIIWILLSKFNL